VVACRRWRRSVKLNSMTRLLAAAIWAAQLLMAAALAVVFLTGCGDKRAATRQVQKGKHRDELPSASGLLYPEDFAKFQPGRSIDEILSDTQWGGNFGMACYHDGKSLCAIYYGLTVKDPAKNAERDINSVRKTVIAIFEDNRFVRFVRPLPADGAKPTTLEEYDRWLVRQSRSDAVNIEKVQEEVWAEPKQPSHIDPGLTVVFGALSPFLPHATEDDYRRNAVLRYQFNGSRIRLGMTSSDVESVVREKPIESGDIKAGSYSIYGSNESFNIAWLHISKLLVLYRDGKVVGAYSTGPAGKGWRSALGERFRDLPAHK
jgi:hypothetical protein